MPTLYVGISPSPPPVAPTGTWAELNSLVSQELRRLFVLVCVSVIHYILHAVSSRVTVTYTQVHGAYATYCSNLEQQYLSVLNY